MNSNKSKTINIRLNSPGGSVFDGTTIFNAIKQHKSKTIAHIDGLAASIASVIALAADEVRMAENAFLMIHEPWSMVIGNADIMRDEAELLDKVGGTIAKTYMDKSKKDEKEILEMMKSETWMSAQEALDAGFVDSIVTENKEKAQNLFDLSIFMNVPDKLKDKKPVLSERMIESVLRDAGCSHKQAKAILSAGYKDGQRDVDQIDPEPVVEPQRDVEPDKKIGHMADFLLMEGAKLN